MEYETFKQQFIDNVEYMAGWSKVPGRCVIESVQISGIETSRIRFDCTDKRVVLPEIYIEDIWKTTESWKEDLRRIIKISDIAFSIRRTWETTYDTAIYRCSKKEGPGRTDEIRPLITNRKSEKELLKNLLYLQHDEIAVCFYVTNRRKKACYLSKDLADIWNIRKETLLKKVLEERGGAVLFEHWIEKNKLENRIGNLLTEDGKKICIGTAEQGTALLFHEGYRERLKEKMGGNFYVFFLSPEECVWIPEKIPFATVHHCLQKIREETFERESWITDDIYFCDGKNQEFTGMIQNRKEIVTDFKQKSR